jgi:hypothetical protein
MSSVPVPGLRGLLEILLSRGMDTLNQPDAQASGTHRRRALFGVRLHDDLPLRRAMAVRTFAITMRLGWLAQAAFVFSALRFACLGESAPEPDSLCPPVARFEKTLAAYLQRSRGNSHRRVRMRSETETENVRISATRLRSCGSRMASFCSRTEFRVAPHRPRLTVSTTDLG